MTSTTSTTAPPAPPASTTIDARRAASAAIASRRRELGAQSLRAFAETYLPDHFRLPPSPMHEELFEVLPRFTAQRGGRLALAAPRGHAKTTVTSLAFVLWCACYRLEPFIVLISDTADQAGDLLAGVRQELQHNERLAEDFPEIAGESVSGRSGRWRKLDVSLPNGVRIQALGAEQKLRGRRHRADRPTLVIFDDIENEELVRTAEQRDKRWDWLCRAALKAGSGSTNFVVVGTLLHFDSILARLLDPKNPKHQPGWARRKFQAVASWADRMELWDQWERVYSGLEQHDGAEGPDAALAFFRERREAMLEGARALWPEREDYYELMELRVREGHAAFDAEKQNDPIDAAMCLFTGMELVFWDDRFDSEDALLEFLGDDIVMAGACDPSLGRRGGRGDPSALVTVARDGRTGHLYILDADIRVQTPDELIDCILALAPHREWTRFGVEANHFQAILASELRRRGAERGVYVPATEITNTTDKIGRIQSLQALIGSGILRFSRRHTTLLEQLRQFPHAAHDDGPDALEMVVRMAETSEPHVTVWSGSGSGFRRCGDDDDGEWPWSSGDEMRYLAALKRGPVELSAFERATREGYLRAVAARAQQRR